MKRVLLVLTLMFGAVLIVRAGTDESYGPVVMAKYSLSGQSASTSPVTEATPASDTGYIGMVHIVLHGSCSPGCPNARAKISYIDTDGNSIDVGSGWVGPAPPADSMFYFTAKGGTNVQFATDWVNITGTGTYDATITLMKVH